MYDYVVFGGCFRSEIAFPELRRARRGAAAWTLRRSTESTALVGAELLGEEEVYERVSVRLYHSAAGYRLDYTDTGCFDISPTGSEIVWHPGHNPDIEAARIDVLGRVFATALHASGLSVLHASAVAIDGTAIAFLAPRVYGKSTLAMAMLDAGAQLVTDDILAVEPDVPVTAWPGVQSVRLWDDSADRIVGRARLKAVGTYPAPRRDGKGTGDAPTTLTKQVLGRLPQRMLTRGRVPLSAIYVILPVEAGDNVAAARRVPVSPVRAALAIVAHSKLGPLLGKAAAQVVFDRAVRVARAVPVYTLTIARDLACIGDVARHIAEWHRRASVASG